MPLIFLTLELKIQPTSNGNLFPSFLLPSWPALSPSMNKRFIPHTGSLSPFLKVLFSLVISPSHSPALPWTRQLSLHTCTYKLKLLRPKIPWIQHGCWMPNHQIIYPPSLKRNEADLDFKRPTSQSPNLGLYSSVNIILLLGNFDAFL